VVVVVKLLFSFYTKADYKYKQPDLFDFFLFLFILILTAVHLASELDTIRCNEWKLEIYVYILVRDTSL